MTACRLERSFPQPSGRLALKTRRRPWRRARHGACEEQAPCRVKSSASLPRRAKHTPGMRLAETGSKALAGLGACPVCAPPVGLAFAWHGACEMQAPCQASRVRPEIESSRAQVASRLHNPEQAACPEKGHAACNKSHPPTPRKQVACPEKGHATCLECTLRNPEINPKQGASQTNATRSA